MPPGTSSLATGQSCYYLLPAVACTAAKPPSPGLKTQRITRRSSRHSSTDENIEIDRNVHRAGQYRKIGNQTIVVIRSVEFIAYFARYDDRWSPDR